MLLLALLEAPLLQAAASTPAPPAPTCHFMPKTDFWCLLFQTPPPSPAAPDSSADEAESVLLPPPRRCYWPINNKNHTGTWCDEIAQIPSPSPEHCCAQCVANSSASPSVRGAPPPPTVQAPMQPLRG